MLLSIETRFPFDGDITLRLKKTEGPDEEAIRRSAELLGLDWEERIEKGYRALFAEWKQLTAFPGRDMIFTEE